MAKYGATSGGRGGGGPLREGFGHQRSATGEILRKHGASAADRAHSLESLIRGVGSEPYRSTGVGAHAARLGGRVVSFTGTALTRRLAGMIAEQTLSEYQTLEAFVHDAPGIDPEVGNAILPLHTLAAKELDELGPGAYSCL